MKNARIAGMLVMTAVFGSTTAFGQRPGFDISGYWTDIRQQDAAYETAAGDLADYSGLPINEADRLYALAYNASRLTLRQHQCFGYVSPYVFLAPGNYRFFEDRDPYTEQLIAIRLLTPGNGHRGIANRTIWMDGRPHPPAYAQHTWAGFSTGKYEGNILTVYTTHMKRGLIRGNGVAQSDQATWSSISSGTATASLIFP